MSIENAILELAAALNNVAESNHAIAAASLKTEESYRASISAYAGAVAGGSALTIHGEVCSTLADSAELEKAVTKVETEAKAEKPSAAKAAIQQALVDAKKAKEAAAAPVVEETDPLLDEAPVELDYEKDVKPLLVKVGKDKQQLVDLLAKFNAKNGAGIAKADYPAVVAAANKIIGG